MPTPRTIFSFRIKPVTLVRLRKEAEKKGLTASQYIEAAIEKSFKTK